MEVCAIQNWDSWALLILLHFMLRPEVIQEMSHVPLGDDIL
jgi:hypothetical protein